MKTCLDAADWVVFKSWNFILAIGSDTPKAAERKHLILSKVPRSRAYRILKNLNDSRTLQILGREHANSILSGVSNINTRKNSKANLIGMIYFYLLFDYKTSWFEFTICASFVIMFVAWVESSAIPSCQISINDDESNINCRAVFDNDLSAELLQINSKATKLFNSTTEIMFYIFLALCFGFLWLKELIFFFNRLPLNTTDRIL